MSAKFLLTFEYACIRIPNREFRVQKGVLFMGTKRGNLSIDSENIFPIIKKWVYSDHDIFMRELVSNGCDAITKLKKLDMMGEYELPDDYKGKIQVLVNPEEKTLKFIDNGLGMTAEEGEEYHTDRIFRSNPVP